MDPRVAKLFVVSRLDNETVKLLIDLGLPEEIVRVIESHLMNMIKQENIYREEHRKKFQFYGFYFTGLRFVGISQIHPWGNLYKRYRILNGNNVDAVGFPKRIKIYCNSKLRNSLMRQIYDYDIREYNLDRLHHSHVVNEHKQSFRELGFMTDIEEAYSDDEYETTVMNDYGQDLSEYSSDDEVSGDSSDEVSGDEVSGDSSDEYFSI